MFGLRHLDLSGNGIGKASARWLITPLGRMVGLQWLDLSGNGLGMQAPWPWFLRLAA